jgi:hypothetical protein
MARPRFSTRAWVEQLESWSARRLWKCQPELNRELSRQFAEGKPLVFCLVTLDIQGHSVSVQVTADRPHFGGVRLWFWCGRCGSRVLKVLPVAGPANSRLPFLLPSRIRPADEKGPGDRVHDGAFLEWGLRV